MPSFALQVQSKCHNCSLQVKGFFCCVSPETLSLLEKRKITNTYSPGSMLFIEGQPAQGVYMLCQGKVKLFTCSRDGKIVILHIAVPGEVLGLSSVVSDEIHEVSAEVIETSQINFVHRSDFLRLLGERNDLAMNTIRHLCLQYHDAYKQIRALGLSSSVGEKFAKLILDWCETAGSENGLITIQMPYTHEEIAEMIGTTRETITRLMREFKDRELISTSGSLLLVHKLNELKGYVGRPRGGRSRM
jgi:CRP/FNR family transcriptional regulator, cyclic AMP receptor protein